MFFQWRQAKYGQEKFHSAMLGHRGEASRSFQETKAFGAELQRLEPVRGTRVRSRVALVVDWDSWWGVVRDRVAAVAAPGLARAGARLERRALRPRPPRRHRRAPPARSTATTSSSCRTSTSRMPRRPPRSPRSSSAAANSSSARSGASSTPPRRCTTAARPARSATCSASRSTSTGRSPTARTERVDARRRRVTAIHIWSEWLELHDGTEVLARYATGELAGRAAATRRAQPHGGGAAWYVSAVLEPDGMIALLREVLAVGRTPGPRTHRRRPRGRHPQRRRHRLHLRAQPRPRRAHGRRARRAPSDLLTGIRSTGRLTLRPVRRRRARDARAEAPPFITLSDTTD